jgi:hypothetical protein
MPAKESTSPCTAAWMVPFIIGGLEARSFDELPGPSRRNATAMPPRCSLRCRSRRLAKEVAEGSSAGHVEEVRGH